MSEYRALRERYSLLELCRTPDLATEVTLQPVRRIEVDAAILFSDLLLPLEPMGIRVRLRPRRRTGDREPAAQRSGHRAPCAGSSRARRSRYVLEAIRQIKQALGGRVPLIGFAGAPFTLASYAIEGGHSNNFAHTKALMYGTPPPGTASAISLADVDRRLPRRADRSRRRRRAGLRLVGRRAERARLPRVHPAAHASGSSTRVAPTGVPTIHFGVGTGAILGELREAGGDVIGADWRTPLDEAWERIGSDRGIQGNLDPTLLLGPLDRVFAAPTTCSTRAGGRPGHIFNLGHGILPSTPRRARAGARAIRASEDENETTGRSGFCARCSRGSRVTLSTRRAADGPRHSVLAGRDAGVPAPRARRAAAVRRARRRRCATTTRRSAGARRSPSSRRRRPTALRARLGPDVPVAVGMRNWKPFIKDALAELAAAGVTRVIGIPLAPQFSTLSVAEVHRRRGGRAARRHDVRARSSRSTLIRCCSRRSPSACARRSRDADELVIFTAHSLPVRVIEAGDRYADEVAATARGVAERAGIDALHAAPTRAPAARRSRGSAPSSSELIDDRSRAASASSSSCRSASSAITPRSCSTSTSRPRRPLASSTRRCGGPSR